MSEVLVRVVAPQFTAALVIVDGRCTEAAPKLRWAIGWGDNALRAYFQRKKWVATIVPPKAPPHER